MFNRECLALILAAGLLLCIGCAVSQDWKEIELAKQAELDKQTEMDKQAYPGLLYQLPLASVPTPEEPTTASDQQEEQLSSPPERVQYSPDRYSLTFYSGPTPHNTIATISLYDGDDMVGSLNFVKEDAPIPRAEIDNYNSAIILYYPISILGNILAFLDGNQDQRIGINYRTAPEGSSGTIWGGRIIQYNG